MSQRAHASFLAASAAVAAAAAAALAPSAIAAPAHGAGAPGTTDLIVAWKDGAPASAVERARRSAGVRDARGVRGLGARVVRVRSSHAAAALRELRRSPHVRYAEVDQVAHATLVPNDPYWGSQWSPRRTSTPAAWDLTTGSTAVTVAVLDTGVDASHPDLSGAVLAGYDFVNGDSNAADDNGHGTSAAGIVAARGNNGIGVAGYCWQCRIMPVKVLGATGSGSHSNIAAGITWATDRGAKVINLSLGGTTSTTTLLNAVRYATSRGVVVVASAGNAGSTTKSYPAAYPETVSVAGTTDSDTLYSWSNYGSWVEMAAPGSNITTRWGGGYTTFNGTSSAAPVIAGIVGLAMAHNPLADAAAIEQAMAASAVRIGSVVQHGRVHARGTLDAVTPPPPPVTGPTPTEPAPTEPAPTTEPDPGETETSPEPTVQLTTSVFSSFLSKKKPVRVHSITMGNGPLDARLSFTRTSQLKLEVVNSAGTVVASMTGTSGMTLHRTLTAGTYRLRVSGSTTASYTLKAGYARA